MEWTQYVNKVCYRLMPLLTSKTMLHRWHHYKRAWKYVLTGSADVSGVETITLLVTALLTSPEMVAVILALLTGLGSVLSMLLAFFPTVAVTISPGIEKHIIFKIVKSLFVRDETGLQFVLTSFVFGVILIPLLALAANRAKYEFFAAKEELLRDRKRVVRDSLYYEMNTMRWYSAPLPFSDLILCLASVFSSWYFLILLCVVIIFLNYVGVLSGSLYAEGIVSILMLGWIICWSKIYYPKLPTEGNVNCIGKIKGKVLEMLAGFPGIPIGYISLLIAYHFLHSALGYLFIGIDPPRSIIKAASLLLILFLFVLIIQITLLYPTLVRMFLRIMYRYMGTYASYILFFRPMSFLEWLLASMAEFAVMIVFIVINIEWLIFTICMPML